MPSRTPPELKWLLVERATLAGDLAKMKARLNLLATEIARVETTLNALDTTIGLAEARVWPETSRVRHDAAGVIRRHSKGYGARGALKAFIVETLQNTSRPLTTRDIAEVSSMRFGLEFVNGADFNRYQRNTIRAQLYQLVEEGAVSKTGKAGSRTVYWQWKRGLPSLADLALLSGAPSWPASVPEADDGHQDPA